MTNEHIKTGSQIHSDVVMDSYYRRVGKKHEKWVSVSWLKEQVEKKQKRIDSSDDIRFRTTYGLSLAWFLSLLEEKQ